MRKLFNILIPALIITVILTVMPFYSSCEELYDDVLRVHILANSDSAADQSLKLCVRDRIVRDCAYLFDDCGDKESAVEMTSRHLREIERAAEDEIRSRGYDYTVSAEVAQTYFNTRYYDDFTMPAGRYDALRLTIGEGGGSNWWCVIYPSLCFGSACEAGDELSDGEYKVITSDRLDFRFKLVEYFEGFLDWFRG